MIYFTIQDGRTGYVFSPDEKRKYFIPEPDLRDALCSCVRRIKGSAK